MGQLFLHHTHPFWKQFRCPCCPVCKTALTPKHAVVIQWLPDRRYMVLHEACAQAWEPQTA